MIEAPPIQSSDYDGEYVHQRIRRTYELHFPPQYTKTAAALPLVIVLHGGAGNAAAVREQTGFDALADREGFITLYPEGTGPGKLLTFNAGICCGYARDKEINDVGFLCELIDLAKQKLRIDPARIYVCGMSNGAMMAYRMLQDTSNRVAAIGAVAAGLGVEIPYVSKATPIIHIHGTADPNAPFRGGVGSNAIDPVDHPNILDVQKKLAALNSSVSVADHLTGPFVTLEPDGFRITYQGRAPLEFYGLYSGGHTWPGGKDVTAKWGTGKLITTFDATARLWEFFKRFTR